MKEEAIRLGRGLQIVAHSYDALFWGSFAPEMAGEWRLQLVVNGQAMNELTWPPMILSPGSLDYQGVLIEGMGSAFMKRAGHQYRLAIVPGDVLGNEVVPERPEMGYGCSVTMTYKGDPRDPGSVEEEVHKRLMFHEIDNVWYLEFQPTRTGTIVAEIHILGNEIDESPLKVCTQTHQSLPCITLRSSPMNLLMSLSSACIPLQIAVYPEVADANTTEIVGECGGLGVAMPGVTNVLTIVARDRYNNSAWHSLDPFSAQLMVGSSGGHQKAPGSDVNLTSHGNGNYTVAYSIQEPGWYNMVVSLAHHQEVRGSPLAISGIAQQRGGHAVPGYSLAEIPEVMKAGENAGIDLFLRDKNCFPGLPAMSDNDTQYVLELRPLPDDTEGRNATQLVLSLGELGEIGEPMPASVLPAIAGEFAAAVGARYSDGSGLLGKLHMFMPPRGMEGAVRLQILPGDLDIEKSSFALASHLEAKPGVDLAEIEAGHTVHVNLTLLDTHGNELLEEDVDQSLGNSSLMARQLSGNEPWGESGVVHSNRTGHITVTKAGGFLLLVLIRGSQLGGPGGGIKLLVAAAAANPGSAAFKGNTTHAQPHANGFISVQLRDAFGNAAPTPSGLRCNVSISEARGTISGGLSSSFPADRPNSTVSCSSSPGTRGEESATIQYMLKADNGTFNIVVDLLGNGGAYADNYVLQVTAEATLTHDEGTEDGKDIRPLFPVSAKPLQDLDVSRSLGFQTPGNADSGSADAAEQAAAGGKIIPGMSTAAGIGFLVGLVCAVILIPLVVYGFLSYAPHGSQGFRTDVEVHEDAAMLPMPRSSFDDADRGSSRGTSSGTCAVAANSSEADDLPAQFLCAQQPATLSSVTSKKVVEDSGFHKAVPTTRLSPRIPSCSRSPEPSPILSREDDAKAEQPLIRDAEAGPPSSFAATDQAFSAPMHGSMHQEMVSIGRAAVGREEKVVAAKDLSHEDVSPTQRNPLNGTCFAAASISSGKDRQGNSGSPQQHNSGPVVESPSGMQAAPEDDARGATESTPAACSSHLKTKLAAAEDEGNLCRDIDGKTAKETRRIPVVTASEPRGRQEEGLPAAVRLLIDATPVAGKQVLMDDTFNHVPRAPLSGESRAAPPLPGAMAVVQQPETTSGSALPSLSATRVPSSSSSSSSSTICSTCSQNDDGGSKPPSGGSVLSDLMAAAQQAITMKRDSRNKIAAAAHVELINDTQHHPDLQMHRGIGLERPSPRAVPVAPPRPANSSSSPSMKDAARPAGQSLPPVHGQVPKTDHNMMSSSPQRIHRQIRPPPWNETEPDDTPFNRLSPSLPPAMITAAEKNAASKTDETAETAGDVTGNKNTVSSAEERRLPAKPPDDDEASSTPDLSTQNLPSTTCVNATATFPSPPPGKPSPSAAEKHQRPAPPDADEKRVRGVAEISSMMDEACSPRHQPHTRQPDAPFCHQPASTSTGWSEDDEGDGQESDTSAAILAGLFGGTPHDVCFTPSVTRPPRSSSSSSGSSSSHSTADEPAAAGFYAAPIPSRVRPPPPPRPSQPPKVSSSSSQHQRPQSLQRSSSTRSRVMESLACTRLTRSNSTNSRGMIQKANQQEATPKAHPPKQRHVPGAWGGEGDQVIVAVPEPAREASQSTDAPPRRGGTWGAVSSPNNNNQ